MSFAMARWAKFLDDTEIKEIDVQLEPGDSIVVGDRAIHGPNRVRATKDETGRLTVRVGDE